MANVGANDALPNLLDLALRSDPNGEIALIAETLSQCNEIITDMIWREANGGFTHKTTMRTTLPQATWRGANQGVPSTKSTTAQVQFGLGELVDYSKVDKALADLNGNTERWRLSEDMAHMEGMSQQMSSAIFYSNSNTSPQQPSGFGQFFNTISSAKAANSQNCISLGGSGSANASLWLIGWGDRSAYGIYPKGMPTGLQYRNLGDVTPEYDSNGNRYEVYTSLFTWWMGLAVEDWRYVVRMCNIDTTTAAGGLLSSTNPDLFAYMARAAKRIPAYTKRFNGITQTDAPDEIQAGIQPAWYGNRSVLTAMELLAIRQKNVLLKPTEYAGVTIPEYRGVPVRTVDALLNTESAVS